MRITKRMISMSAVLAAIALGVASGHAQEPDPVRIAFEHAIPNVPGKSLIALVVTYPPGSKSPSHRHADSAFIYAHVLSGAIRSRSRAGPAYQEAPRPGGPRFFSLCDPGTGDGPRLHMPPDSGRPLSRWSARELARAVIQRGIVSNISVSTVKRWLHADQIKPWQYRSWQQPTDPRFLEKAIPILELYERAHALRRKGPYHRLHGRENIDSGAEGQWRHDPSPPWPRGACR